MPTWLLAVLPYIVKAPTIAAGLLHMAQAIAQETATGDGTLDKATKVVEAVAAHGDELGAALLANTPHA